MTVCTQQPSPLHPCTYFFVVKLFPLQLHQIPAVRPFFFLSSMPPKPEGGRNAYAGVVQGAEQGTPVAAQRIWQEHVLKELRFQVVREDFKPNPSSVSLLPDKPSDRRREVALRQDAAAEQQRAELLRNLAQQDPQAHAQVIGQLERSSALPRAKYPTPQTSSHEIGWDLDLAAVHRAEAAEHSFPHTNGDVTAYADAYVNSHGYHPFSTHQFKYLAKGQTKK